MTKDDEGQRRFGYLRRRPETVAEEVDEEPVGHIAMRGRDLRFECFRLAEEEGFEPPVPFPAQWFSRPPP